MQVLYKQVLPKPGRPLKMFTKYFHAPKQAVTYCGQLNLILNVISQGTYIQLSTSYMIFLLQVVGVDRRDISSQDYR